MKSTLLRWAMRSWVGVNTLAISAGNVLAQGSPDPFGPLPAVPGATVSGGSEGVRAAIINVIKFVLNFMALVAVIFIIIAGIRLVVSQGEDEQKEKSKKTIIYVIVGLIVILFARVVVEFVASAIQTL